MNVPKGEAKSNQKNSESSAIQKNWSMMHKNELEGNGYVRTESQ